MQEEVTQKTIALSMKTGKLTAQGAKTAPWQAKPETAESPRRGPDQH